MSTAEMERTGHSPLYDLRLVQDFFRSAGQPQTLASGTVLFAEQEKANRLLLKRDRMYLVLDGEIALSTNNGPLGTVGKSEVLGEMACISHTPRSATATAKTDCTVIALDEKQFLAALQKQPAFGLMMLSIMIGRLRETVARLAEREALPADGMLKEAAAFDRKHLAELAEAMSGSPPAFFDARKVILREGQTGILMYVVLEGQVAIRVNGVLVERVMPGGVFGEMALIDHAPRAASAVAETDCSLLAINRANLLKLMSAKPAFGASLLSAVAERGAFMASRFH